MYILYKSNTITERKKSIRLALPLDLWSQAVQCFPEVLVGHVDQGDQQDPEDQHFPKEKIALFIANIMRLTFFRISFYF